VDPAADPPETADTLCRDAAASHWCSCVADQADMTMRMGTWSCDPFVNVISTIAIFDRVLDTAPLDPDEPTTSLADIATAMAGTDTPVLVVTDYGSNGTPTGLVIPLFAVFGAGNFRTEGPSLFTVPESGFPSGATITVALNAGKVKAKDGTTPFVGTGALLDGVIKFATAAFTATVTEPDTSAMSMDTNTVTVAFSNLVDAVAVTPHITATVTTGAVTTAAAVTVTAVDDTTVAVAPVTPWPAGSMITITVDAATPSKTGETLGTAVTKSFPTP
jgi:hypothetical protein